MVVSSWGKWAALCRAGGREPWTGSTGKHWAGASYQVPLPVLPTASSYPRGNWPVAVIAGDSENDEWHGKNPYLKCVGNLELINLQGAKRGGTDKSVSNNECCREGMS